MSEVKTLTDRQFSAEIRLDKGLKVVDFWAPWCEPCKKLSPIIDQVAKELGDQAQVWKLNVDQNRTSPATYQVRSIPAVLVFFDGEVVERLTGVHTKEEILKQVRKYILS
ncbi:thioredoxin [Boudabousia liubingyangii]|uniref:Thioredoxin n=1 Tax=Boudabousia liubingyangii TaxID=1921764 RepID=A0A1Q5PPG5_9ACTO|nr:thioredoxin [Boudabousia liubingyangii]OKL48552.1 thioredoxin [Boudabousia liubingyangii]OKL49412.1 thioredoxin [Boudabousia liubingyangii]